MLTHRQRETYNFIAETIGRTGRSPSYQDIADAIGLASRGGVCRIIDCLVERGVIYRRPNHERSIEFVRVLPASTVAPKRIRRAKFDDNSDYFVVDYGRERNGWPMLLDLQVGG